MFEGAVAGLVNRLLGEYVQDLDTENLNVGIFAGDVTLTDLKLKPEALYELDLPIEVKLGTIGRVSVQIPWASLSARPAVVRVADVLVLAGPAGAAATRTRLQRAAKRLALRRLDAAAAPPLRRRRPLDQLLAAIMNNIQIYVTNVHIRYEDSVSSPDGPLAAGFCLQSLSIETTNSKWKPSVTPANATTVYQLMRAEAVSLYWNPAATVLDEREVRDITPIQYYNWKHHMITGLEKLSMHREDFEFLVRPCGCRVKALLHRSAEARVPRLLLDVVLPDAALALSSNQYASILLTAASLRAISVNSKYRHLHPGLKVSEDAGKWWRYAFAAVWEQRVRPRTWAGVRRHRAAYRRYRAAYAAALRQPHDTELKLDLQKCEDDLPIDSVVIAREHAKMELLHEGSDLVKVVGEGPNCQLVAPGARPASVWGPLSSPERARLSELVGFLDSPPATDKSKKYIEHKVNVTVGQCCVWLLHGGKELMALTLTQLMGSLETRPAADAYKISCRAERLTVEGLTAGGEGAGLVGARGEGPGAGAGGCLLAVDLERNPAHSHAQYALTFLLEPIDVLYVEHTVSELMDFFRAPTAPWWADWAVPAGGLKRYAASARSAVHRLVERQVLLHLNVDVRGVSLLLPEHGCLTRGGKVCVLEVCRLSARSELQGGEGALEGATCMELEERLYDRLHVHTVTQVLFSDLSGEWREARRHADSDLHLVPRLKGHLVFSNTIKKDYKLLPRYKLNVSLSSLKLNISDGGLAELLQFCGRVPRPRARREPAAVPRPFPLDRVPAAPGYAQLVALTRAVAAAYLGRIKCISPAAGSEPSSKTPLIGLSSAGGSLSEHSEEELEVFARTVDLPGFEDNISPHNRIHTLLRFVIGEVVINVCESRSNSSNVRPYLMLVATTLSLEAALRRHGAALQSSVRRLLVADRKHHDAAGHYLEILAPEPASQVDLLSIIYRKVGVARPELRRQFRAVERALVADLGPAALLLHAPALRYLHRYLHTLWTKIKDSPTLHWAGGLVKQGASAMLGRLRTDGDPPLAPGATKFSYSVRWSSVEVQCAGAEARARAGGLAVDCVSRADDRLTFRLALASLHLHHLSPATLYSKVVWPEEDCVLEVKYSRAAAGRYCDPRPAPAPAPAHPHHLKADGELRVTVGRIHCVCFFPFIRQLLDAVEAVLPAAGWRRAGEAARRAGAWLAAATPARLALIIQIHAPVLLLPQKLSSPNLLLINIGDLSVENLFKSSCGSEDWAGGGAVDNILAKLDNFTASRALMMLAGALQVQEAIVEPLCVRCDVKRAAGGRRRGGAMTAHCGAPRLALGQRDVATLCALATDNLAHAPSLGWWWSSSEAESSAEEEVDRLQAFLKHEDARANSFTLKVSVEGLEVKVYRDCEEVVSSPVREAGGAVARLRAGEAWLALRAAPRQPTELTIELATLGIDDIRPGEHTLTTKIFRRIGECRGAGRSGDIVVWRAPLASAHCRWRHRAAGAEAELNIDIDTARLTISIPFFAALVKLIVDALPGEQVMEGGVVNLAYEGDAEPPAPAPAPVPPCEFSPHDVSTPQCLAGSGVVPRGRRGVWGVWGVRWGAVGVRWRRPEVAVCGRAAPLHLLARAEILLDYSARDGADNLVISLAGLEVVSRARGVWGLGGGAGRARGVVGRCDLDVARARSHTALTLSPIHLTLTPALYHTVVALSEEISSELGVPEEETSSPPQEVVVEELWTGRKLGVAEGGVGDAGDSPPPSAAPLTPESVTLAPLTATIVCEGEVPKLPLLHIQLQCELSVQDCNRAARGCGVLSVRARVLDARARRWEPLLEPVLCGDKCYPWEIKFTIFQGRAHSISTHMVEGSAGGRAGVKTAGRARRGAESEPGSDSDSLPVRAPRPAHSPPRRPRSPHHSVSDDDDRPLPTLDDALAHLFTDESSSDEASESDDSSEPPSEAERPPDAASDTQVTAESGSSKGRGEGVSVSGRCSSASSDSGVEAGAARCAHVVVRAARPLQLTVAPAALAALTELARAATHPDAIPNPPAPPESPLTLINDIGPGWSVTLRCGGAELAAAHYDRPHSRASSPGGDDASLADALEEAAADTGPPPAPAPAPDTTTCDNEGDDSDDGFEDDFAVEEEEEEVVREEMDLALPAPRPQPLHTITISAPDFEEITVLCPRRCARALHAVGGPGGARYHLLLERDPHRGGSTVLLRSPLQVRNETMYALEVWCRGVGAGVGAGAGVAEGEARNPFNGARRLGLVPPHQPFNVPLRAAYHAALHFQPANENFSATTQGVWWEELTVEGEEAALQLVCSPRDDTDLDVFALHVLAERGPQPQRAGGPVPDLVLRVLPPLAVHNRLPVALELTAHCGDDASEPAAARREVWRVRLEAAEHAHTHRLDLANPYVITVNVHYQGVVWTGAFLLTPECKDRSIRLRAEGEEPVKVRARVSGSGTRLVQVYAPHWLANRTELEVQVRAEGGARALRLAPGGGVALWGAPRGVRLQVRAHGSAWSRPARLAPHAPALLSCPHAERRTRYRLLGAARPAALCPALTTVVTLEPLFVVTNRTRRPLRYMEANEAADLWLELPAGGAAPFWPQTASFRMHVKLRDSHHLSPPFPIDREHTTVLRMDRNSALTVVVSGGGVCPRTVTLRAYAAGDAPLLLRNLSPQLFLKLQQPHAQQPALLPPRHQLLYTWDDPAEDRHLLWSVYHARGQFPARIDRDGYGEERVVFRTARRATVAPTTSVTMKLSSTLRRLAPAGRSPDRESSSGEESDAEAGVPTARRGRAVVYWVSFTEGPQRVLAVTQDEREAARLRARVEGHLAAVEVYVSLAGVGLSVCAAGRELLYASVAESAPRWEALVRQRWRPLAGELGARLEAAHRVGRPNCRLGEAVAVDLERMLMTKPVFAELRRAYSPAVWLQVRCGDGLALWHARLRRLQIDDQLPAATFPVALRPAPPPAGVPPRPFVELAMLMCEEPVPTIKYLKLIVQEFRVELDRGLLSHVAELARSWVPAESAAARLRAELGRLHAPPEPQPRPAALRCEALHVAPLKFSVSLSPRAAAPLAAPLDPLSPDATLLDYALDVWETSTLDARDVVFKVSYMEVTATWVRWGWVWGRWGRGAAAQLSLQGCAQLLGRDVLGNKFARAGPHPDGFLAYYEPHEGTLAVAGVARCRRALALCAAAPMLGRGAGAGGVPLPGAPPPAALAAPPPTPALAQLLADHCTGVCRTAWRSMAGGVGPGPGAGAGAGAGEEGGEGRAVRALRRAAARAGVQLVARARLPRAVLPAQGITEYRWYCAAGAAVWRAVGGGRGAGRAEQYVSHAPLEAGGGALLLLTSRRVYAVRCGPEDCAALWSAALAHLHGPPTVHGTRILFALRQDAAAHHFATATRSATGHCPLTMRWFAAEVTAALAEMSAERALPPAGKS